MKVLKITLHISFLLGILSSLYCKRYDVTTWQVLAWAWFWRCIKEEDRADKLTMELSAALKELKELKDKEAK